MSSIERTPHVRLPQSGSAPWRSRSRLCIVQSPVVSGGAHGEAADDQVYRAPRSFQVATEADEILDRGLARL